MVPIPIRSTLPCVIQLLTSSESIDGGHNFCNHGNSFINGTAHMTSLSVLIFLEKFGVQDNSAARIMLYTVQ
jgi:hypothetical protein